MRNLIRLCVLLTGAFFCSPFVGAGIVIDYSHDTFFNAAGTVNATAKASLEAAVADINAVLDLSSYGAITAADNTITESSGGGNATFTFAGQYTNPSTGATESLSTVTLAAEEIRIYVGMRNLNNSVAGASNTTLGQGGPGITFLSGLSAGGNPAGRPASVNAASAAANAIYSRGNSPVITNQSGSFAGGNFDIDHGSSLGNLWFDSDTNNDGNFDSNAELDADWHFDHTTAVASGKNDFYSVALHETLHAIGYGTSESWLDLSDGIDWTGAALIAERGGSGDGLVVGGHLQTRIGGGAMDPLFLSERIDGGGLQAPVMTPSILTGTRKTLTQADLAVLQDIGFTVVAVPEPSCIAALAAISCVVSLRRRRR
jgi:hypothetical protein